MKNIPDPVLWERAAHWTPEKRLRTAKKFERWARQLRLYTQAASMNDELDYAGTHVMANVWFKLGISKHQSKLLVDFADRVLHAENNRREDAAWWLLNAALANIEIMESLLVKNGRRLHWLRAPEKQWDDTARVRRGGLN